MKRVALFFLVMATVLSPISGLASEWRLIRELQIPEKEIIAELTRSRASMLEILKQAEEFKILAPGTVMIRYENEDRAVYGKNTLFGTYSPDQHSRSDTPDQKYLSPSSIDETTSPLKEQLDKVLSRFYTAWPQNLQDAHSAILEYISLTSMDPSLIDVLDVRSIARRGNRYTYEIEKLLPYLTPKILLEFYAEYVDVNSTPGGITLEEDVPSHDQKQSAIYRIRDLLMNSSEHLYVSQVTRHQIKAIDPDIYNILKNAGKFD